LRIIKKHLSREQPSVRVFEIRLHAYASFQGKPFQMLNIATTKKGARRRPFEILGRICGKFVRSD
jgi:hypothetical protein